MSVLLLPANTPQSFYRGGSRISRFRGVSAGPDPYRPEDWIASTTSRFQAAPAGLTVLPDGKLLADAIASAPDWWLGALHVARFGITPAILVKLLDAGQRLPLHVHPDRPFAAGHLASPYGKTEAWVIVSAEPDAVVHLGFSRDVSPAELADWVAGQNVADMLAATNHVPVRAGDAVLCPAGVPHAIGAGILLVEVQEPTDFSVLLEWDGFLIDGPTAGHLGLGFDVALQCVDRSGWGEHAVAALRQARPDARPGIERLFPMAADEFFAAERLRPDPAVALEPAYSVVVVTAGTGTLENEHGEPVAVGAGHTLLIPYAAGHCELRGMVEAIRLKPPMEQ
ncbi:MAG TPA: class I mannose-6-phosphate isomerase [Actinoplanes sp.]|jgi:mannose-6-phosphate isomerase